MPSRVGSTFSNPENKSLSELVLTVVDNDGVTHKISALHKHWATRQVHANPPALVASAACICSDVELEEWLFVAQQLREDFQYLLSCQQYEFWSHMVYEKTALSAVVLFLQRAIPFYTDVREQIMLRNAAVIELYEELLSMVLRILCRLVTNKESADCWMSKEQLRTLLYSNYLISVPMLCDLLIAVGDVDAQTVAIVKRLFDSVLHLESKYKQDILAAIAFFRAAFKSIQTQAENEGYEGACGGAADDEYAETLYDDVALYTLDCAYTLALLLEVCPAAIQLSNDMKMAQSIAHFYDNTIPFLYKNICLINENAKCLTWLNQARIQYLRAFRTLAKIYIEEILAKPQQSLLPAEAFIALLTECLSEQTFVVDYARLYPVDLDMDVLKQACSELDEFKAAFVREGYQRETAACINGTFGHVALNSILSMPEKKKSEQKPQDSIDGRKAETKIEQKTRDLDLETTAVLEVLPHLGTGFVRRVLLRYNNSEEAIAAILEENLPPDLAQIDQAELYIPPDPADKLYRDTGIKRYNVYDGDAYDIMSRDKPDCIIKQGKGMPNAARDAAELLDDKKHLKQVRHIYEQYQLVSEDLEEDKEYNDEYDDSYEALLDSENRLPKSKLMKAALANIEDVSEDESEEDVPSTHATNDANIKQISDKKPQDFCENPELARARYEQYRQAKWGNRQQKNNSNKTHDVVGAPKGQGQDKETVRNRQKKGEHKSTRANHNRKAGASFKRSKGMIS